MAFLYSKCRAERSEGPCGASTERNGALRRDDFTTETQRTQRHTERRKGCAPKLRDKSSSVSLCALCVSVVKSSCGASSARPWAVDAPQGPSPRSGRQRWFDWPLVCL